MKKVLKEKLKNYVINEDKCHIWQGCLSRGYAVLKIIGINTRVHRHIWEQANGPIPKELVIRHKCNNPSCINLSHLEIGTHQDNENDKKDKLNKLKDFTSSYSKLTKKNILYIRNSKKSNIELGEIFSISKATIADIKAKRTWSYINSE